MKRLPMLVVLGMMFAGLSLGIYGIEQNLPYAPEVDEPTFVDRAVRMAATSDMNPLWFGHPGSTTIYPLALAFHIWYVATQDGDLLAANPELQFHFDQEFNDYYLIGRLLSVLYTVLTLPLIYLLGKRVFDRQTALIGAWLFLVAAFYSDYPQLVRSDMAATFWGLLALWLCVRVYDRPSWQRFVLAGLAIGLSIGSRYFMVTLAPVLFIVWAAHFWKSGGEPGRWTLVRNGILGALAIAAGFALISPYFFLAFDTTVADILHESRSKHLGADGLSKWGNAWWYMTVAFPQTISWPYLTLAIVGIVLAAASRKAARLLPVTFVFIFMFAICLSALHWARWILQLLPLMALFAASVLNETARYAGQRFSWPPKGERINLLLMVVVISILPLNSLIRFKIGQSGPTTRIEARQWIIENIPAGSKIVQERYTAILEDTDFELFVIPGLGNRGTVERYTAEGYDYLIVSSNIYERFLAEPERYPAQVAFYNSLSNEAEFVQYFEPSLRRDGPTVVIFKLGQQGKRDPVADGRE